MGDRDHILLFLANVSLPSAETAAAGSSSNASSSHSTAVHIASAMTWVGYNPGINGSAVDAITLASVNADGRGREPVFLDCGYQQAGVVIPQSLPKDALRLQQLVLSRLPQGPGAAVPSSFKAVPSNLLTVMLWTFQR